MNSHNKALSGTILLDEVGEMSAALQAKLLHALQDRQFTKLGSNAVVDVDVRVVAATNRDLEAMIPLGEFREDLYYRLNVIELTVPPLRDRRDELPSLIEFFVSRSTERYRRPAPALSSELQATFQRYEWPGNIRELENMIKRIVILQDEGAVLREIASRSSVRLRATEESGDQPQGLAAIPDDIDAADADDSVSESVFRVDANGSRLLQAGKTAAVAAERAMIEDALRQEHWNRRRAAVRLGVSYKTLLTKIKESGVLASIA